jgi:heterodisulfide reductase subunit A-like polyferredoxin
MSRVGVFVCHCGENIARNVKVQEVVEFSRDIPGAVVTADYPYLCSARALHSCTSRPFARPPPRPG